MDLDGSIVHDLTFGTSLRLVAEISALDRTQDPWPDGNLENRAE